MTDFSHQQIAERFAQAVKDGNIRFGRVASSGAMGQAIQVRQDSGQMVRAIAQNNCTPGELCTLFFLDGEVRAYGSNDVATIERSLRYRRHREQVASIEERILALLLYEKPAIVGLLAYLKKETIAYFSILSILYEVIAQEERIACTCPTYNRVGNRCVPVCDGTGQYATLQQCLAAPEPPWPDPAGQDGGGGYWVLYGGYKQGTRGGPFGPYTYPAGDWQGGIFYSSLLPSNPCSTVGLNLHPHYAPASFVDARPADFPPGGNRTAFWVYYNLPLIPKPTNGILASMKNAISTSGTYEYTDDGWFILIDYNNDVFVNGQWLSGDNIAYGICFVGKYVPYGNANNPPTPPTTLSRSVGGVAYTINLAGITLIQNRAALICSPFNGQDPTCTDPGRGNPPISCPFPEDKRSRTFYLGGSKQGGLEIHKLHYQEPYFVYAIATEGQLSETEELSSKETVKLLHGKNKDGTWCAITEIKVDNRSLNKNTFRNPILPPLDTQDWKRSTLGYQSLYPNGAPPVNSFIDNYRYTNNANIQSATDEQNNQLNFLVEFNAQQKVSSATNGSIFEPFLQAIRSRDLISARLCIAPIEGYWANRLKEKGFVINKVFKLPPVQTQINIIGYSGWVSQVKLAHKNSSIGCKALQATVICNSTWQGQPSPCSRGSGKLLSVESWQPGETYKIKVVPGSGFSGGTIQVWGGNSGSVSPTNRRFVKNIAAGEDLFVKFDSYNGLLFQQRDLSMGNRWKTLCISWNNETQTVTLEAFR